jgi:hypothetical protein
MSKSGPRKSLGSNLKELLSSSYFQGLAALTGLIAAIASDNLIIRIPATLVLLGFFFSFALLHVEKLRQRIQASMPVVFSLFIISFVTNLGLILVFTNHYQSKKHLPIDEMPLIITTYQGRDSNGNLGSAWLNFEIKENGERVEAFRYRLPEDAPGTAGLVYRFPKPKDFTTYEYIQLRVRFDPGAKCSFWLIDNNDVGKDVLIGDGITPKGDIAIDVADGVQTISIPLKSNFGAVNQEIIIQLEFDVDTNLSRGENGFEIESIRLLPDK